MADQIFPSAASEKLGSEKVFNGIDYTTLGERMAANKEADTRLSDEILKRLSSLNDEETEEEGRTATASTDKRAKKTLPDALKQHQFKPKNQKDTPDSEDEDKSEEGVEKPKGKKEDEKPEEMIKRGKEAKASPRQRKVHFAHASQLTAEAVEAAKADGDEELANTILAARHARREILAQKIDGSVKEQMEKTSAIAKRHAYRMNIVSNVEDTQTKLAKAEKQIKVASVEKTNKSDVKKFKTVEAMTNAENASFIKLAESEGFPREYVEALLGTKEAEVSEGAKKVMSVMASTLDSTVKVAAVQGLVKTAELTDADYSRLKRYWKDELGYGDAEWVDDLFSKKYDK